MITVVNPFKPSAGANPPELLGREDVLDEFEESLISGPGSPNRLLRITGSRGVGKTVLLNALAQRAKEHHWEVFDETATVGFTQRLVYALQERSTKTVKSVEFPSLGVDGLGNVDLGKIEFSEAAMPLTLRTALTNYLDKLCKHHADRGVFITVDETQGAPQEEIRALAIAVQHLIRENRNIAVAFAGLPGMDSFLLHDSVTTFLRRATPAELKDVPLQLVRASFGKILCEHDYSIDDDALDLAASATYGYPFMIQLVGYNIWRQARSNQHIDAAIAREGIEAARIRLGGTVHEPAVEDLSEVDRTYLLAMAQDDGPSRTGDIAKRIGRDAQYAGRYRERLLQAGIIYQAAYGYVDFTIPYLREWLKQHAATLVMRRVGED